MPQMLEQKNKMFLFLLILFITIIYSNTFHVPFILDDNDHIKRSNLHLSELTINNVFNTFFLERDQNRKIYRPISCLTIALNYYIGRFNPTGYHAVNLIIHILTAIFLYNIFILLLGFKKNGLSHARIKNIAGLATILWAIHPIQTQAITYIIQRMASLAAMFYTIGIYLYLKARIINKPTQSKKALLCVSFLFFLFALLSKENAALFPVGILLIEICFFDLHVKIRQNYLKLIFIFFGLSLFILLFFIQSVDLKHFLTGYELRPFTCIQRVLTEPRILLFHIYQLLYPIAGNFSISHSILPSNSLFSPITTFFSVTAIILIVLAALLNIKRFPLIVFPILFYFSHHLVESTILPLELIMEHRNYLPSLFFFLPVSYGFSHLINKKKIFLYYFLIASFIFLIFLSGISTYTRNMDWQNRLTLWKDAIEKTPDLIRPYSTLGEYYYTASNHTNIKKARDYFRLGLDKKISYSIHEKVLLWVNIAKTYEKEGNTKKAIDSLLNALKILENNVEKTPYLSSNKMHKLNYAVINLYLSKEYFKINDLNNSLLHINIALKYNDSPEYLNIKAICLIKNQQFYKANKILQISLKKDHENYLTYNLLGDAFKGIGDISRSNLFNRLAKIKEKETKK